MRFSYSENCIYDWYECQRSCFITVFTFQLFELSGPELFISIAISFRNIFYVHFAFYLPHSLWYRHISKSVIINLRALNVEFHLTVDKINWNVDEAVCSISIARYFIVEYIFRAVLVKNLQNSSLHKISLAKAVINSKILYRMYNICYQNHRMLNGCFVHYYTFHNIFYRVINYE